MAKALEEMSREELWQLFPIALRPPRAQWAKWYQEEEAALWKGLAGLPIHRVSHVGSTAIGNIWAKDIVDILLEAPGPTFTFEGPLKALGYRLMAKGEGRSSFNKGYTPQGFDERVYHLHLRAPGDNDELYFRDYLRERPALAKEYEALKLGLWKQFEHDRDGYTAAKTEFVQRATQAARALYGARYR